MRVWQCRHQIEIRQKAVACSIIDAPISTVPSFAVPPPLPLLALVLLARQSLLGWQLVCAQAAAAAEAAEAHPTRIERGRETTRDPEEVGGASDM